MRVIETSWGDGCSCASLDFSDVISESEPELPSDWSGDVHTTVVCAKPDLQPLQIDGRLGANLQGTGARSLAVARRPQVVISAPGIEGGA